jgi:hypothetical protein
MGYAECESFMKRQNTSAFIRLLVFGEYKPRNRKCEVLDLLTKRREVEIFKGP